MRTMYTLEELTDSIIEEFQLQNADIDRNNYHQSIYRALKRCNLLNKGIKKRNPDTNRMCMYYTEVQKRTILADRILYDYVRTRSGLKQYNKGPKYKDVIASMSQQRQEYIDYLSALGTEVDEDNESDPYISDQEYRFHKTNMMFEALFSVFFTPIDDELLRNDLEQVEIYADPLNPTIQDLAAQHRLENPEGIYYKRLDSPTKESCDEYDN